ncbi:uncharacterized protein EI90DRAFT_273232 [Cantharellus anzutake]|uniref:uncharacterized protein n=1 Tax=Cantharellus anzutake TaxID=1750568 RepID=UPI0019075FE9|nr:uncharacterized protein EI90DRAFT_273232 [Cantharellus anzutake]KAF8335899.1 hypothetical protein EI90DRAFT_273232 [Cantharellus anzutake]
MHPVARAATLIWTPLSCLRGNDRTHDPARSLLDSQYHQHGMMMLGRTQRTSQMEMRGVMTLKASILVIVRGLTVLRTLLVLSYGKAVTLGRMACRNQGSRSRVSSYCFLLNPTTGLTQFKCNALMQPTISTLPVAHVREDDGWVWVWHANEDRVDLLSIHRGPLSARLQVNYRRSCLSVFAECRKHSTLRPHWHRNTMPLHIIQRASIISWKRTWEDCALLELKTLHRASIEHSLPPIEGQHNSHRVEIVGNWGGRLPIALVTTHKSPPFQGRGRGSRTLTPRCL